MIEDELRSLLGSRADEVADDNAGRVGQVHSRISAIRRRRAVGAAVGLVLLAVAGLALTRLPGRPDALPTAVPNGPYFDQNGQPSVPGYNIQAIRPLDGPTSELILLTPAGIPVRALLAVRCEQPGLLVMRNLGAAGPSRSVDCSQRVAGGFEGAVGLEPAEVSRLFALTTGPENIRWEPGNAGRWTVAVLAPVAPDRLPPWSLPEFRPILDGAGGTVPVTIPARPRLDREEARTYGFQLSADCVEGVELSVSVPAGPLVTLVCDKEHGLTNGHTTAVVTVQDMARLGLHAGDRVRLTVRSTGRQTDQWRVWPLGT
jgi:hypothetical protein